MSKRPELLVTTGEKAGLRVEIPVGGLRVGRSSTNDLPLPDGEMSRTHCLFEQDGTDGICVQDLASANGTYVNGDALEMTPRPLKPGDRIEIGQTVIKVVSAESVESPPAQPVAAGPVDLGLSSSKSPGEEGASASEGASVPSAAPRSKLANLLCAAAVAVLVTAIVLLLTNGDLANKVIGKKVQPEVVPDAPVPVEIPLSLTYERVEANPTRIARYAVALTGENLELVYDAQGADQANSQKVDERGRLSAWSKKRLDEIFDSADWLGLESVLGPNAMSSNALNSWRLKLVRNGQVKEVVVENTTMPSEFRTICETLETLVNNDLSIQLSLRTPEECLASSRKHEELADELLEKWEIKDDNMWEGIKCLKRARNELKGLSAYYEDQNRLQTKIEAAEARLKERYDAVYGVGERARQIEDWKAALVAYREIRAMIPDTTDQRGADAETKLRDIEGRLEEANRKGKRK